METGSLHVLYVWAGGKCCRPNSSRICQPADDQRRQVFFCLCIYVREKEEREELLRLSLVIAWEINNT